MQKSHVVFSICFAIAVPLVAAQCSAQCDPVSSLVGACNLPSLQTDRHQFPPIRLNLTGTGSDYEGDTGPGTNILSTYDQAKCLCTQGRMLFIPCQDCLYKSEGLNGNTYNMVDYYHHDCNEMGYFKNSTFGYPSTTGTSPPQATSTSITKVEVCGVLEGQLQQCNLLPLSNQPPATVFIEDELTTELLRNRTSGECLCTLPVLRRFYSCWSSIKPGPVKDMVYDYENDCGVLGYWTDTQFVNAEPPTVTSSSHTASSPTSTSVASGVSGGQTGHASRLVLDCYSAIAAVLAIGVLAVAVSF